MDRQSFSSVLVTFSSETGKTSNRYPGVRITPFKKVFLDVLGAAMLLSGFLVWDVLFAGRDPTYYTLVCMCLQ